jgi:cytochrome c peroxidase
MKVSAWIVPLLLAMLIVSCAVDSVPPAEPAFPVVPAHFPAVPIPADNPITIDKIELGRWLFYDKRLSRDRTVACASCHRPEAAFTDAGKIVSGGVGGARGLRNSPTVVNAAYQPHFFWDGRAASLEEQAMGAFLSEAEMFADTIAVASLLRSFYQQAWKRAFGDTLVTMKRAMQAIATFERTVISAESPYDHFLRGDTTALTSAQRRGMQLFFSSRTMCANCHMGPNLTDDKFHNIGLFSHYFDKGRFVITRDPFDEARFKTPTLRNVELTAPYMAGGDSEEGEMWTLEQVVEHYAKGGKPFATRDFRVRKLDLSKSEEADLVAFLKALTDPTIATNPKFSKPMGLPD